jgi:uncharacterized membrane protein
MGQSHSRGVESTAAIARHPLHPMLVPLPIAAFIFAFVTDLAWLATARDFWAEASYWLLLAGVLTAIVAAVPGVIDYYASERVRRLSTARVHAILNSLALLLGVVNLWMRSDQASTPILGTGFLLSLATVAVLAYSGWLGGELSYRHGVGVMPRGADDLAEDARARPAAE